MIYFEQFADALIGFTDLNAEPIPIYLRSKMVEILEAGGMENASEWIEFNVEGFRIGELSPIVCDDSMTIEDAIQISEDNATDAG